MDTRLVFLLATCGNACRGRGVVVGTHDAQQQGDYAYIARVQIADRFPDVPALLPLCATYDPACEAVVVVLAPGAAAQVPCVQRQADGTFTVVTSIPPASDTARIDITERTAREACLLALDEDYAVYVAQME